MIPLVVRGAKTSLGIGVVAPEVQYLITNFRNDFAMLKKKEAVGGDGFRKAQLSLIRYTVESLRGVFKLHTVNLFDVFKVSDDEIGTFCAVLFLYMFTHLLYNSLPMQSPLLQIPIFWYFALDLRQVINGADPILAQALVDTTFLHITDLTEPDPYYALPIATGALLYFNVETAVGKRALSGETSSQSRLALVMKDFFQSLAIFMPCFMVQQPSGVQIYLMTSMVFSLCQSVAMRNDAVREAVGLPPMYQKPKGMEEGKFVKEFMEMMRERQEAKARGEFILGEGVLRLGSMPARVGRKKKSTIEVSKSDEDRMNESVGEGNVKAVEIELPMYTLKSLLVNPELLSTRPTPMLQPSFPGSIQSFGALDQTLQSMPDISMDVMEKANRGEKPVKIEMAPQELLEQSKKNDGPIDINKLKMKREKQKGKNKKR
jgi:hypothetical protein